MRTLFAAVCLIFASTATAACKTPVGRWVGEVQGTEYGEPVVGVVTVVVNGDRRDLPRERYDKKVGIGFFLTSHGSFIDVSGVRPDVVEYYYDRDVGGDDCHIDGWVVGVIGEPPFRFRGYFVNKNQLKLVFSLPERGLSLAGSFGRQR